MRVQRRSHFVLVRLPRILSLVEVRVTVVVKGFPDFSAVSSLSILIKVDGLGAFSSSSSSGFKSPFFASLSGSSWNSFELIILDSSSWSLYPFGSEYLS